MSIYIYIYIYIHIIIITIITILLLLLIITTSIIVLGVLHRDPRESRQALVHGAHLTRTRISISISLSLSIYIYTYKYICMCIYTYIYIYITYRKVLTCFSLLKSNNLFALLYHNYNHRYNPFLYHCYCVYLYTI